MAYLKTIAGFHVGQICEIDRPELVLGRHPDCNVTIDGEAVSRHHAQITIVDGECFLKDLHSRNGTFLNDEQIHEKRRINGGDLIRIGDTTFRFHRGHREDSRRRATLDPAQVNALLVDDDDSSSNLVLVSRVKASSIEDTNRSKEDVKAQLKALLEITRSLQNSLSLHSVLPQILDSLFVIFSPADRGFIVLRDRDGEIRPHWTKLRSGGTDEPARISRTIINRVMETQEAILSADAAGDARFISSNSISALPIRSLMCAPLIDGEGNSFGVLQIDTLGVSDRFGNSDLEVLVSVAAQASVAIDNARLHEYTLRQRTIERDLELAYQIQRSFLPKDPPQIEGYEFYDYYRSANRVGGDFYDYVPLPDGRTAVVVADIVGHGLAAAMLTAKLAADVRFQLLSAARTQEAITQLNDSLARQLVEDHFITLVVAVLAPQTGRLTIVNAGHMLPVIRRTDGRICELGNQQANLPLGIVREIEYQEFTTELVPGEVLTLYTDGVSDAMNDAEQIYSVDRVLRRIESAGNASVQLGREVIEDVRRFTGECVQRDDMCLICLGRK